MYPSEQRSDLRKSRDGLFHRSCTHVSVMRVHRIRIVADKLHDYKFYMRKRLRTIASENKKIRYAEDLDWATRLPMKA